jgi:hypothetical protein
MSHACIYYSLCFGHAKAGPAGPGWATRRQSGPLTFQGAAAGRSRCRSPTSAGTTRASPFSLCLPLLSLRPAACASRAPLSLAPARSMRQALEALHLCHMVSPCSKIIQKVITYFVNAPRLEGVCSQVRECVLFIGTQFSNLYTTVDTPAEAYESVVRDNGQIRDRFLTWKERLAAAGTGEGKSLDTYGKHLALQPG